MAEPKYKLAVSAIAWEYTQDRAVGDIMQDAGVGQVELAPTKIWPDKIAHDPLSVTDDEIRTVVDAWAAHGVQPVAMQSMLFLRPEMTIFETNEGRVATLSYLKAFITLAGKLGVKRMVFGSPKNRRVPEGLSEEDAWNIALDFFRELGGEAEKHGVVFCIEPNPEAYQCNFVTNAAAGARLVREVNVPGFGLHLDAAGMTLAGDSPDDILENADILRHFHISAPYLGNIAEDETVPHSAFADALKSIEYDQTVSIEMRPGQTHRENLTNVSGAIDRALSLYF